MSIWTAIFLILMLGIFIAFLWAVHVFENEFSDEFRKNDDRHDT